jgi:hypothetical protein
MPAISYSKDNIKNHDFKNKILQGIKIHTIRRYRKRPFKLGDTLYHFENFRTPKVNKFHINKCLYLADIEIKIAICLKGTFYKIIINDKEIKKIQKLSELATNDGFDNFQEFRDFFIKSGLPFKGQIIGWKEGISYGNK